MFDFDWTFPYPSQRMPVFARDMVATSQPLAAEAGLEMFRRGGNAVDAAVAAAITLTVVEPTSNGIGSDAFALVWRDGRLAGLNASGRAPAAIEADRLLAAGEVGLEGWDPVTVPGAVSGWASLVREHGLRPFAEHFEAAIGYAREGFPVSPQTADGWRRAATRWPRERHPAFHETFLSGGRGPETGAMVRLPDHARTLEAIAASGGEDFYRGELAAAMDRASRAAGAALRSADLQAHRADWVEPIAIDYRGWTLHEMPPNGQGIAAQMMLGIVAGTPAADLDPECPDRLHLQIEAMKLAFRDVHRHVGDPAAMRVSPEHLLDPAYLATRGAMIDPERATDFDHGDPRAGGTVLVTAAGRDGTMISLIQSNYTGFG